MTALPLGLVAELTYRCPLHCPYCSNPLELARYSDELSASSWQRVLEESRAIGVLQVHLSGGEPMVRKDIGSLVEHARSLGMYTNLVTSGIGLSPRRMDELVAAGLDHVQMSIQDASAAGSDRIAGTRSFDKKLAVAPLVVSAGLPLTVNVVLHRSNVDNISAITDLAASLGADRLELAHTQYYGWGQLNQPSLLPTPDQVTRARMAARAAIAKHGETMQIVYVLPDFYERRPKPCMYGWGARHIIVNPNGDVLPCTAAAQLPGISIENVERSSLSSIWFDSDLFNKFRGNAWMPEPCQSCEFKELDHGGCRCQAFQMLGDMTATDPVCEFSPRHDVVESLVSAAASEHSTPTDFSPTSGFSPTSDLPAAEDVSWVARPSR